MLAGPFAPPVTLIVRPVFVDSDASAKSDFKKDSFPHVLIGDSVAALPNLEADDTPYRRRFAPRTTVAGIEGLLAVSKSGIQMLPLSVAERSIVFEETYEVDERGVVRTRPRFVPLRNNVKALVRIVRRHRSNYNLDFDHPGWSALLGTLEVRHRLTHPTSLEDFSVSKEELANASRGFHWFLAFVIEIMTETNDTLSDFNEGFCALSPDDDDQPDA